MTITRMGMLDALHAMSLLSLVFTADGQADLWADTINDAAPETMDQDLMPAVRHLAATRTTDMRGQRVTVADLLQALQDMRAGTLDTQRARLKAVLKDGALEPDSDLASTDTEAWLAWKRHATRLVMEGATRQEAVRGAWQAIGRTPPPALAREHHPVQQLTNTIGRTI